MHFVVCNVFKLIIQLKVRWKGESIAFPANTKSHAIVFSVFFAYVCLRCAKHSAVTPLSGNLTSRFLTDTYVCLRLLTFAYVCLRCAESSAVEKKIERLWLCMLFEIEEIEWKAERRNKKTE